MNSILWITVVLSFVTVHVQSQQNNDFFYGIKTEASVLVHSEHIFVNGTPNGYVTASMDYYGGRWAVLRFIEAFDQNIYGTGARVNGWGIGSNAYLSFESSYGGDINFLVAVYAEIAEPILFQMGQLSEHSILAHSEQLRLPGDPDRLVLGSVGFDGRNISRLVAYDRNTNKTGARLLYVIGGVSYDYAQLGFISYDYNESIDVDVYYYLDYDRDLIIGSEYESTVFLEAQIANATSTGSIANSSVHFQLEQPRLIGMIQALSLNNQRSHINITEGGLNQHNITMNFTSQEPGSDVNYMVAVYSANDVDNARDFRLGVFQHGDSLLHTERVTTQAEIGQYVSGYVTFEADRNITMIQGFDLVPNGNGGIITAIAGGIGYRNVTVAFYSQFNQTIDFNVQIYGRLEA